MRERKKDNMFPPEYITYNSLTTTLNKEQICGDLALAEKIKEKSTSLATEGYDLYTTTDMIKEQMIKEYGEEFYLKSGAAIHTIVEEVYNNITRHESPLIDKYRMEEDLRTGIVY